MAQGRRATMNGPARYERLEKLGEGTYGSVYKAFDTETKRHVAVKVVRCAAGEDDGLPATAIREITILKALSHPNIVSCVDEECKILIFDDVFQKGEAGPLVWSNERPRGCPNPSNSYRRDARLRCNLRFPWFLLGHLPPFREKTTYSFIDMLKRRAHALHEVMYDGESRSLDMVIEYCAEDLRQHARREPGRRLPPLRLKSLMYQLLCAVAYCHSRRIVHRDLKPQNILIGRDGTLKLADFGLSRVFTLHERAYTHEIVTLWYRAPEVLLGATHYSTGVDVWSCGCLLFELAMGTALFRGDSEIDQLYRIFRLLGTPTEESWPGVSNLRDYGPFFPKWPSQDLSALLSGTDTLCCDLMQKMLALDPNERVSAREALDHPFFSDLFEPTTGGEGTLQRLASVAAQSPVLSENVPESRGEPRVSRKRTQRSVGDASVDDVPEKEHRDPKRRRLHTLAPMSSEAVGVH